MSEGRIDTGAKPSDKQAAMEDVRMVWIDPRLCDSLEEVLLASKRYALLEVLCHQRDVSSPNFDSTYRLLRTRHAQGHADEDAVFDRALQLAADNLDRLAVLATYAVTRRDAFKLVRVRVSQTLCDDSNATFRQQLLQVVSHRLKGSVAMGSLDALLGPLGHGSTPELRVLRAVALEKWGDDTGLVRMAWIDSAGCAKLAYSSAMAQQIAVALVAHSEFALGLEMLQLAWERAAIGASELRALRTTSVRTFGKLPWGHDVGPLLATPRFREVVGEGFAKSLVKVERWDLLVQLRLVDYCCAGKSLSQRKRLVVALDHCQDAISLQTLGAVGARFRHGELDTAKILAQLKRYPALDHLLQASPARLPLDRSLLALWTNSLLKRGDVPAYCSALVSLALSERSTAREKAVAVAKLLPLDRDAAVRTFVANWAGYPAPFNPLLARLVSPIPLGEPLPLRDEFAGLAAPHSEVLTRTLVRLKRWDLLAQIRLLQFFAADKASAPRARLIAVLRHCDEAMTLSTLRAVADKFPLGEVEVARLLSRIRHDTALDHFVAAGMREQTASPALLAISAESLLRRGDTPAYGRALGALVAHPGASARERVLAIEKLLPIDIDTALAAFARLWLQRDCVAPAAVALAPRIIKAIPWGQPVVFLGLLSSGETAASDVLARLLGRLKRWDLLAQLRLLQYHENEKSMAWRARLTAVLKHFDDPRAMQTLGAVADTFASGRLELARILSRTGRFSALDRLLLAGEEALPADPALLALWLDSLRKRGDLVTLGRALGIVALRPESSVRERVVAMEKLMQIDAGAALAALVRHWLRQGSDASSFPSLSARVLRIVPWGQAFSALTLLTDARGPTSSALARSLLRLERWDLLVQLRLWQLCQTHSRQHARLALSAVLRHCKDLGSMQTLWQFASGLPGAQVELIRLIGKLGRFEVIDALLDVTPGEVPGDCDVAAAWAETHAERGDLATWQKIFRTLIARASTPLDWIEHQAIRFKQRQQWDMLDWVRLRQFKDEPSQKLRVSSHLKALQAVEGAAGTSRFIARLAVFPVEDSQAAAYVRRLIQQQQPGLLTMALKARLQACPDDLQARLERLAHWEFADTTEQSMADFGEHVDVARAALACVPRTTKNEGESASGEIDPIKLPDGSKLATLSARYGDRLSVRQGPLIEAIATATHHRGTFEIWSGYEDGDIKSHERERRPNDIRVAKRSGEFLAWLVESIQGTECLEIGSGFGTSGMYISSALEELQAGRLRSYEPNVGWAAIADANIKFISGRGSVFNTTFEHAAPELPLASIDFAFIDAIHTPEAVAAQLELVKTLCRAGATIVIDDVNFSKRMYKYWRGLTSSSDFIAAAEFFGRFGVLELH